MKFTHVKKNVYSSILCLLITSLQTYAALSDDIKAQSGVESGITVCFGCDIGTLTNLDNGGKILIQALAYSEFHTTIFLCSSKIRISFGS